MGLIRVLVALHPKGWREAYGAEFTALLEDSALTPRAVADVVSNAARLQAQAHATALWVAGGVGFSGCCEAVARHAGLTANILWAPTTPLRALPLAGLAAPWVALAVRRRVHGRAGSRMAKP